MRQSKQRVLVVEDDLKTRRLVAEFVTEQGYEVLEARDGTEALEQVRKHDVNLVVLDYQLPDFDGLRVLNEFKKVRAGLPVIMVSGHGTVKLAVEATKQGAYDFLEKPLDADQLILRIKNALEWDSLQREVAALRQEVFARSQMVGDSPAMRRLREMIDRSAPSKATVLILGESGVGKELVARAVYRQSLVSDGPYVRINCAAIPDELVESELFGYERGAFTGAVAAKPGKLELADGGTVFLDEIGDMSLPVQARLLRFLQEGEFERVGGTKTLPVDVRVIAATNKNLTAEIEQRRFREDLYYRLSVVVLEVPPLRERTEDIPALARFFLDRFCAEHGVPVKTFSSDALSVLASQPWPGNVREFANVVQRCVVLLRKQELSARDIAPLLGTAGTARAGRSLRAVREDAERRHVLSVLAECDWHMTEAARVLEVDRTTLYRMLDRLGVLGESYDRSG